jgi:hypothetical protein
MNDMQHSTISVQRAQTTCGPSTTSATDNVQRTADDMQRATHTMQDAQDFMQHALWQHALCSGRNSKQQIACNMHQATCNMQETSRRE